MVELWFFGVWGMPSYSIRCFLDGFWNWSFQMMRISEEKITDWSESWDSFSPSQVPQKETEHVWMRVRAFRCIYIRVVVLWNQILKKEKKTHIFLIFNTISGNDPNWRSYCSKGLVQPPTRIYIYILYIYMYIYLCIYIYIDTKLRSHLSWLVPLRLWSVWAEVMTKMPRQFGRNTSHVRCE